MSTQKKDVEFWTELILGQADKILKIQGNVTLVEMIKMNRTSIAQSQSTSSKEKHSSKRRGDDLNNRPADPDDFPLDKWPPVFAARVSVPLYGEILKLLA